MIRREVAITLMISIKKVQRVCKMIQQVQPASLIHGTLNRNGMPFKGWLHRPEHSCPGPSGSWRPSSRGADAGKYHRQGYSEDGPSKDSLLTAFSSASMALSFGSVE